jgi:hypothetical protein
LYGIKRAIFLNTMRVKSPFFKGGFRGIIEPLINPPLTPL